MKKQTSVYLSDKDNRKLEVIKKTYETENTSEILRVLIDNEYETIKKYQELNI